MRRVFELLVWLYCRCKKPRAVNRTIKSTDTISEGESHALVTRIRVHEVRYTIWVPLNRHMSFWKSARFMHKETTWWMTSVPVRSRPGRGSAYEAFALFARKSIRWTGFLRQSQLLFFLVLVVALQIPLHSQSEIFDGRINVNAYVPLVSGPIASDADLHSSDRFAPGAINARQLSFVPELLQSISPNKKCTSAGCDESYSMASDGRLVPPLTDDTKPGTESVTAVSERKVKRPDRNLDIYYRNRREFSLDVGWHPVNIPFVYDFAVGDSYNMTPLKYTLVPVIASLRWHVTNVGWRWIFRGNMDFTFSASITAIPRGPETHYYSLDFGIRRNFVYRNWKVVPYFEQRGGAGLINAKEPVGVIWAQGQNLTFTYNMGAGIRYNFDSKYSFSAGMNYMHISNGYLSQPAFYNYGINVYGPMFGLDIRLGKHHHSASQ